MKFAKIILSLSLIFSAVLIGFLIGQNSKKSTAQVAKKTGKDPQIIDLFERIKAEKIRNLRRWEDASGKELFYVIREIDEPPIGNSNFISSEKYIIYNEGGEVLYETKDLAIGNTDSARLLNLNSSEIIIEKNGGGTDWFLEIISRENGKYKEVIDTFETQFRGGYFIIPQYRTGVKSPYFKPSQLIVIQQGGGAEDDSRAAVFRGETGKLKMVGEFSMQNLGDFIEKEMKLKTE